MMNIIHIINRIGNGGSEVVACNLAREQSGENKVAVISIKPSLASREEFSKPLIEELEKCEVRYHELDYSHHPKKLLQCAQQLHQLIADFDGDLVHLHTEHPEFIYAMIKPFLSVETVRTIHNDILWPTSRVRAFYSELMLGDCSTVVISKSTHKAYLGLRSRLKLSPSYKVTEINNAVYPPEHLNGDFLQLSPDKQNVGFIGRLTHQKGVDVLLDALCQSDLTVNMRIHIIGDGEMRHHIESIAKQHDLDIICYGTIGNASSYIHLFDLMVIPSRYEGFGLVSLECTLAGTPALISDSNGLRDTLPEDWPLKFDSENPQSLLRHLKSFFANQHQTEQLMLSANEFISDFTIENQSKQYYDVYQRALSH